MIVVRRPAEMRRLAESVRAEGRAVVLVPTMGFLHEGHLALLREGRKRGDVLVLSIFVNPIQFGRGEDLEAYPRSFERDLELAKTVGTDIVYAPVVEDMYPEGFQTQVEVSKLQVGLCGDRRPGHFRGVATVVLKLFSQVRPQVAVFGEKDFQQLQVIRRMTRDLDLDVDVVGVATVREADGLAMSSRNKYLEGEDRQRATALSRGLLGAREAYAAGQRESVLLLAKARQIIDVEGIRIDYLEIRDAETLVCTERVDRPAVMAVAAFVGSARLIDNIVLE